MGVTIPEEAAELRSPEVRIRKFLAIAGPEATRGILDLFLQQVPLGIRRLKAAVAAADTARSARQAHGLRSACCQFGSGRLEELLLTLELQSKAGSLRDADRLLSEVGQEFRRVRDIVRAERPPKA